MNKKLFSCFVLGACFFAFAGCGIIDMVYLPPAEDTAQEIFEAANDAMHEKNYVRAVELYTKLRDTYPFSPYTIDAELSLADAHYLDGDYELASESYKDFESLHPRHPAIPYVLYQTGMSLLRAFRSIDRTTVELQEAYDCFNRLCQTFPDSQYVADSEKHMVECRKLMAEHELFIADVFWHMKKYGPAWRRYTYITENFSDNPDIVEHAREKGKAAYYYYKEDEGKAAREERQGSWNKWFKSWL